MQKPIDTQNRPTIILASGSPRRRELLGQMGWRFVVESPDVDETTTAATPSQMVDELCERKARAVALAHQSGIVLAADTLVAIDQEALGKPLDPKDAHQMLRKLSGRTHEVLTGVCMMDVETGRTVKRVEKTEVEFFTLTDDQIDEYIDSGEPMDKAGAYGIQGGARPFIRRMDGSFENVMGLPIQVLEDMLHRLSFEVSHSL